MVEFYIKLIKARKKTLGQIPSKWREAVRLALEKEGYKWQ